MQHHSAPAAASINKPYSYLRSWILIGSLLIAVPPSLATTFSPSQAAITSGQYALRDTRIGSGTLAYRPLFENISWQGDLVEYAIDAQGNLVTDARPDAFNLAQAGTSGGCGKPAPDGCWTASATFARNSNRVSEYWKEISNGRHIFTYGDSDDDGIPDTQVPFLWDRLGSSQRTRLDAATQLENPSGQQPYGSPLLNYLRGDNSGTINQGGVFRNRFSLLGDIVNSSPVYIGPPREHYTLPGFIDFKNKHSGKNRRPGRIAVGANDGMLHVFDERDGSEVYAYIPSMLLGKLSRLAQPLYQNNRHSSFVDGQLTSVSAQINGHWKTVLAGGLGSGGRGLFALDVTQAGADNKKILFELNTGDIGYINSPPSIVRLDDKRWYLLSGNGQGASNGGRLLLINLDDGSYHAIATGQTAGLSGAAVIDTNADQIADIAYAGDSDGKLWKFYLGKSPTTVNPELIYQPAASIGTDQPIMTRPEVGIHPQGGYMVMFGTGSLIRAADTLTDHYPQQAIIGIHDNGAAKTLVEHRLETHINARFHRGDQRVSATIRRIASRYTPNAVCDNPAGNCTANWKLILPVPGERISSAPQLRNGRLLAVTTNPSGSRDNWLMSLNYLSGDDAGTAVFDINTDARLDTHDRLTSNTQKSLQRHAPVGLYLGQGYLSRPSMARLQPGVDALYINGLHLPATDPQSDGPLLYGHLDVITRSPFGGEQSTPENKGNKSHAELGITAYVHDYDTQHQVSYVDILQLEPRRHQPRLSPLPFEKAGCTASHNKPGPGTNSAACLQAVPATLDRLLHDPLYAHHSRPGSPRQQLARSHSEVFTAGSEMPLSLEQQFIVVVANADLSPAAELQIGCRRWNARDYQDMITSQLESGKTPDQLRDKAHNNAPLIFSLTDIVSDSEFNCPHNSPQPTLRIQFDTLDILHGGIHGSHRQCVLNRPSKVDGGYRWRNGALTVQLLSVKNDTGQADYILQNPDTLPTAGSRIGGTYAQVFSPDNKNQPLAHNRNSGVLHETSVFWHLQYHGGKNTGKPVSDIPCYGQRGWRRAVDRASRALTAQHYQSLFETIDVQVLRAYDDASLSLQTALADSDNTGIAQALVNLNTLLNEHDELVEYHQDREFAPQDIPAETLRELDRQTTNTAPDAEDTTRPAQSTDIIDFSDSDNSALRQLLPGPTHTTGQRAWTERDD